MTFFTDLKKGKTAENYVVSLLKKNGINCHRDESARTEWDIIGDINNSEFTIEVKFDEYEGRTGNLAIEVANTCLGKPSGIAATKAFFWCFVLYDKTVWVTQTDYLKKYLDKNKPAAIIEKAGDGNATLHLYLSIEILSEIFSRIDNMNKKQMQEYFRRSLYE